jgi:hypothetical protein
MKFDDIIGACHYINMWTELEGQNDLNLNPVLNPELNWIWILNWN